MWQRLKQNKISLLVIVSIAILLTVIVTSIEGIDKMRAALLSMKPLWLLVAIACYLTYWFLEAYGTHILIKKFAKAKQNLKDSVHLTIIGKFFDCITPSSTGGQPIQVYHLSRQGVSVGRSSSLLIMKLVIYQFTVVTLSALIIFVGFRYFLGRVSNFSFLAIIGLSVNVFSGVVMFVIAVLPKVSRKLAVSLLSLLHRLHLVKNYQQKMAKIDRVIQEFSEGPALVNHDKRLIAKLVAITIVQIMAFYLVAYFVFLSLNLRAHLLPAITAATCVYMISSYVPLPGGSVGAEGSFFLFFSTIYSDGVGLAVLFWRFITYYMPIIIGSFFIVSDNSKKLIKKNS